MLTSTNAQREKVKMEIRDNVAIAIHRGNHHPIYGADGVHDPVQSPQSDRDMFRGHLRDLGPGLWRVRKGIREGGIFQGVLVFRPIGFWMRAGRVMMAS
jgi:hypothetical protein